MKIWVSKKERRKQVSDLLRERDYGSDELKPVITGTIDRRRGTVQVSYPEPKFQLVRATADGIVHIQQQY